MQPLPHHYRACASGSESGAVTVDTHGVDPLATHAPPEFGGPDGHWSPETLLVAAVADCYVLSFRAVARAARLPWEALTVDAGGVLDRVDGVTRFTSFTVQPRLRLPAGGDETLALGVLEKAKRSCLVTNSMHAECTLEPTVLVGDDLREPAAATAG